MTHDAPRTRSLSRRLLVPTLVGASIVSACAAQKSERPPAGAPRKAAEEARPEGAGATSVSKKPADAYPGEPAMEPGDAARSREIAHRAAIGEVELAFGQVGDALSSSACASACRALASLRRAVGHLCELSRETDERERCEDARRRYEKARGRVRSECVTCAGGPSLEPGEPPP